MEASTSTSDSKKMVELRSSDGKMFEVEEEALMSTEILKNMIEMSMPNPLPLYKVNSTTLATIVEFWNRRLQEKRGEITAEERKRWEKEEMLKSKTPDDVFPLILAGNYLEDKPLIDLVGYSIAAHIKDMTVEEARDYFGIENDFDPQEEENMRREDAWAFV